MVFCEFIILLCWIMIGLGLLWFLIIVRVDIGMSGGLSVGDWMGIVGGFIWVVVVVVMKLDEDGNGIDFILFYFVWGSVVVFFLFIVLLDGMGVMLEWDMI